MLYNRICGILKSNFQGDQNPRNLYWSNGVDPSPGVSNWGPSEPNYGSQTSCVGIDPSIATSKYAIKLKIED